MVLERELERRRVEAGAAYLDRISDAALQLERGGLLSGAMHAGDQAPDFALDTPDGSSVVLSGLLRRGPVVVSFYRGEWCAFCRAEIAALLAAATEISVLGASLVMISPEPPGARLVADVARLGQRISLLHDRHLGVALLYGLVYRVPETLRQFYLGRDPDLSRFLNAGSWLLPIPADVVVAVDGRVALSHVDADFTRRFDPGVIVGYLRRH